MEDSTITKLEAVNESLKSIVIIGTVDILSHDEVKIVDLVEESDGIVTKDRPDLVGFPLSEAKVPSEVIKEFIKHYRESEKLQRPVEFEFETSSFATEVHPLFHVIVSHEGGNRFSFVLLNLSIKCEKSDIAHELDQIYKPVLRKLWEAKTKKYRDCFGPLCSMNKQIY